MTKSKKENMAPPAEGQTPPPPAPPPAPPITQTAPPIDEQKPIPVSTESIVTADKEVFPPGGGGGPPPGVDRSTPENPEGPKFPDKPPGYKGTGRPKGSRTRVNGRFASAGSTVNLDGADTASPEQAVDYEALANMAFDMGTQSMAMLIGPEWLPGTVKSPSGAEFDERLTIVPALAKYLESKEVPDLPPGVVLCLCVAMYSSRRFRTPNTREKLGGLFGWVKNKVFGIFRRNKKPSPGAVRTDTSPKSGDINLAEQART